MYKTIRLQKALSKMAFNYIIEIYKDVKKNGSIDDLLCLKSFLYRCLESRWYMGNDYKTPSNYIVDVLMCSFGNDRHKIISHLRRRMELSDGHMFFDFLLKRDYGRMI